MINFRQMFALGYHAPSITRWWFQICFIFTPTWENDPTCISFALGRSLSVCLCLLGFFLEVKPPFWWSLFQWCLTMDSSALGRRSGVEGCASPLWVNNLTSIFFRVGWNHQLDKTQPFLVGDFPFSFRGRNITAWGKCSYCPWPQLWPSKAVLSAYWEVPKRRCSLTPKIFCLKICDGWSFWGFFFWHFGTSRPIFLGRNIQAIPLKWIYKFEWKTPRFFFVALSFVGAKLGSIPVVDCGSLKRDSQGSLGLMMNPRYTAVKVDG